MNYYYTVIKGCRNLKMEDISKLLPNNISHLGFFCSNCNAEILNLGTMCSCCNEDYYYTEQVENAINNVNKYFSLLIKEFKTALFDDYKEEYNFKTKVIWEERLEYEELELVDYKELEESIGDYNNDYIKETIFNESDMYDIAYVYSQFVKNKKLDEKYVDLLDGKLKEYYSDFEYWCKELEESYQRLSNMLNEYRIVFAIPKNKDEFNKENTKETFVCNNKKVTIETKALKDEYKMEYGYLEVYKDENGVYQIIE